MLANRTSESKIVTTKQPPRWDSWYELNMATCVRLAHGLFLIGYWDRGQAILYDPSQNIILREIRLAHQYKARSKKSVGLHALPDGQVIYFAERTDSIKQGVYDPVKKVGDAIDQFITRKIFTLNSTDIAVVNSVKPNQHVYVYKLNRLAKPPYLVYKTSTGSGNQVCFVGSIKNKLILGRKNGSVTVLKISGHTLDHVCDFLDIDFLTRRKGSKVQFCLVDNRLIITDGKTIACFVFENKRFTKTAEHESANIRHLQPIPGNRRLVSSASAEGNIVLWDIRSEGTLQRFDVSLAWEAKSEQETLHAHFIRFLSHTYFLASVTNAAGKVTNMHVFFKNKFAAEAIEKAIQKRLAGFPDSVPQTITDFVSDDIILSEHPSFLFNEIAAEIKRDSLTLPSITAHRQQRSSGV